MLEARRKVIRMPYGSFAVSEHGDAARRALGILLSKEVSHMTRQPAFEAVVATWRSSTECKKEKAS